MRKEEGDSLDVKELLRITPRTWLGDMRIISCSSLNSFISSAESRILSFSLIFASSPNGNKRFKLKSFTRYCK